MSMKATPYRIYKLTPTVTTTYSISDFTDTVLDSVDEYIIECEAACSVTQKTSLLFQISVDYNSPQNPAVAYLKFMRSGI